MAEEFTSYSIDNDRRWRSAVEKAHAEVKDLTIPLKLISRDFYKSERAIWLLKSPGLYPDLAPSTKKQRRRTKQPMYPILKRSGALERSMTDPTDSNAINAIINKVTLMIGTMVRDKDGFPYPLIHQLGSKVIPMRKFLFIGPEAPRFATSEQQGRLERWMGIMTAFVEQKSKIMGEFNNA